MFGRFSCLLSASQMSGARVETHTERGAGGGRQRQKQNTSTQLMEWIGREAEINAEGGRGREKGVVGKSVREVISHTARTSWC